jgi:tRNA1(Val) A37 N6-methylase TrmN6
MKVGTDSMLLGAWAPPPRRAGEPDRGASGGGGEGGPGAAAAPPLRVLDVGTGTGVLALMAAQKSPPGTLVDAIDVDAAAAAQAAANAAASAWADAVRVRRASLQEWAAAAAAAAGSSAAEAGDGGGGPAATAGSAPEAQLLYDAIISNPPFFQHSSKPPRGRRAAARHADVGLPLPDLAACAAALLRPGGALALVLPPPEARAFLGAARRAGLGLVEVLQVFTRAGDAEPKRLLLRLEKPVAAGGDGGEGSKISSSRSDSGGEGGGGGGGGRAATLDELCRGAAVGRLVLRRPREEGSGFTEDYVRLTAGARACGARARGRRSAAAAAPTDLACAVHHPRSPAPCPPLPWLHPRADFHHPDFFKP